MLVSLNAQLDQNFLLRAQTTNDNKATTKYSKNTC